MDMLIPVGRVYCGYCLGDAEFNQDKTRWEHAANGERITNISAGDYVSAAHNQAGTKILAVDLIDDSEDDESLTEPITDSAGYLSCGCHGSRSDHICKDRAASEYTPET